MSARRRTTLLLGLVLLPGCDAASSPGGDAQREARSEHKLPPGDTGRIDLGTLEGRLVFGAGSSLETTEVYSVRPDGSGLAQLTENDFPDFDPSWSPDGSEIAFRRQRNGNDEIFLMASDGTDPRNLSREPAVDWGPDWSPDGRWIAFNSGRDGGMDLHGFVVDPLGKRLRRLSKRVFVEYPSWSPDGRKIAFMSQTWEGLGGNYEIFVMNADGSGVTQLTDAPGDDGWPAWSPDGTTIVFTSIRDDCAFNTAENCKELDIGEFHTLYAMDADGSNQRRITEVFGQFPVWSPDGEYIAFTPAPGGINVMRPDGSDLTLIPIDGLPGEPEMPDWVA